MQPNAGQPQNLVEQQAETTLVVVLLDITVLWEFFGNDYQRVQILSSSCQLLTTSAHIRNDIRRWHFIHQEIDRLQQERDDREQAQLEYAILQEVAPLSYGPESISWESWMFLSS